MYKRYLRKIIAPGFKPLPLGLKFKVTRSLFLPFYNAEVIVCKTTKELEDAYKIRYKVYLEEGYIEPRDYPTEILTDKYDKHSITLLAKLKGISVGTVRLINYSSLGFPIQKVFNIKEFPVGVDLSKAQEVSKLAVLREWRELAFPISLLLIIKAKELSEKAKINYWFLWTTRYLFENFFASWFNINYEELKTGVLTPENYREREIAGKLYFQKYELLPYIVYLKDSY